VSILGFTSAESLPYLLLLILCVFVLINNYREGFREVWAPSSIIAVIFAYYCLLGPYEAVSSGNTSDRLIEMRQYYASAFWGAFVSFLFCMIGYRLNTRKSRATKIFASDDDLGKYGKQITIAGFILFTISVGGNVGNLVNPFNAEAVETTGGSLTNYLSLSLNFMIPGVTLLFGYFIKTKKGLLWFIGFFLIAIGLFTTMGFRFRIVLLVVSIGITYYLVLRKRPNLLVIVPSLFVFISVMGFIGTTRKYGRGLDLSKTEKRSKSNFASGLEEAKIFQTSGAVIDLTPDKIPYAGFEPLISTILFPIPKAIYADKNSADYVFNALNKIYGKVRGRGAAFMMYAEYYLAFGWLGIAVGSFVIGWIYKRLWLWYVANQTNTFVIVVYAVTVSFMYVIMSRGYLPQVTMLFFFSVFPVYFAWWRVKKKYRGLKAPAPASLVLPEKSLT
jgi:oligosaccharide repeat unit polymerase